MITLTRILIAAMSTAVLIATGIAWWTNSNF